MTDASIGTFYYYPGFGFVEDGAYQSSVTLKGAMTFDIAKMKKQIETFSTASIDDSGSSVRRFSLEVNAAMDGCEFAVSGLKIASSAYTEGASSSGNNADIVMRGLDDMPASEFGLSFSFKLLYVAESTMGFPDIGNDMLIKLTPGEYSTL